MDILADAVILGGIGGRLEHLVGKLEIEIECALGRHVEAERREGDTAVDAVGDLDGQDTLPFSGVSKHYRELAFVPELAKQPTQLRLFGCAF